MSTVNELLASRAETEEMMVLSEILCTRKMALDLAPAYFCGANGRLYSAISEQWEKYGEVQPDLLAGEHTHTAARCLEISGNASREVVDKLHRAWLLRCEGLIINEATAAEDPMEALTLMQERSAEAMYSQKSSEYNHRDNLSRLFVAMERGVKENLSVVGYPTGIEQYDRLTNGLEPGKLYVIGALKKTGKSRWMVCAALHACEAGAGVIIDSLEMSPIRLNQLALAYYSDVSSAKLGRYMTKEEYARVSEGASKLAAIKWRIYRDHAVAQLRSRIIYESAKEQLDVVFVDFIQRMRDDRYKGDRVREVERISQDLADLARSCNVAVVALTQLRGEAENVGTRHSNSGKPFNEDDMPNMSHVKESQGIAENADAITILHNPTRHDNPYAGDGSYLLPDIYCKVEQRDDVSGSVIKLRADLRTCHFDIARD